ncbi:ABC transporter ATP-binding protein [bacterium]|jgi:ABC-type multidrug transport system fused ATPase/permease subunit|nr:ABC transporter ATP-binding protein [bacterium]
MSNPLPISTVRNLFDLAGLKIWVLCWFVSTLVLFGVEVGLSYSMQQLIALLMGNQEQIHIPGIQINETLPTFFVVSLFTLVCLRAACTLTSIYSQEGMREKTTVFLRNRWVRAALFSPLGHVEQSQLSNLLTEAIPRAGNFFASFMSMIFQGGLAILYMVACLVFSPNLFIVALFMFVIVASLVRYVGSRSTLSGNKRAEWMATLNQYLLRAKQNHKLIKLLHMENYEVQAMEHQSSEYFRFSLKVNKYYAIASNAPNSFGYVTVTLILLLAIYLEYKTNIIIFIYILFRFSQCMGNAAGNFSQVRSLQTSFIQANELPGSELLEVDESCKPSSEPIKSLSLKLERLDHPVETEDPILENFELTLNSGEALAIIGPSGCGKSTLLDSILRLYRKMEGEVLINDQSWKLGEYTQRISYVSSDPYLIGGSLFENLKYGNHNESLHTSEWMLQSLKVAQLDDLASCEQDLHSIQITESGLGLSTGQKQRLAIARAIARKPDLLILDEATSNLDSKTESNVWTSIQSFLPQILIILVTHRRSLAGKAGHLLDFRNSPPLLSKSDLKGNISAS